MSKKAIITNLISHQDTIQRARGVGVEVTNNWSVGDLIMAAVPNDPNDPTPFSTLGGFIQGTNVVAFVCFMDGDASGDNHYTQGEIYTAGPCPDIVGGATSFLTGGSGRFVGAQLVFGAVAVAMIAAGGWYTGKRWLGHRS